MSALQFSPAGSPMGLDGNRAVRARPHGYVAGVVLLAMAESLVAQPPSAARSDRSVTFADLDSLTTVSDLALSRDGSQLAFTERGLVLTLPVDGSTGTRDLGAGQRPTWSPDGLALAVIAPAGEEGLQIFRVVLADGARTQLTHVEGGVLLDRLDWSIDGEIVFSADVPVEPRAGETDSATPAAAVPEEGVPLVLPPDAPDGYALAGLVTGFAPRVSRLPPAVPELFVHHVGTGETRQLTRHAVGYRDPAWSPDGSMLVAGSRRGLGDNVLRSGLWLVDPATGEATVLVPEEETATLAPAWSPDGRAVAYEFHSFTDAAEHGVAMVQTDVNGVAGQPKTVFRGLVNTVAWSGTGAALYLTTVEGVARPLLRLELSTDESAVVGSADHVVIGALACADGVVAWVESNGQRPAVIMVHRDSDTAPRAIHDANPELAEWALGEQVAVTWRNRHGHSRSGVLIKPVGYRAGERYPLVVSAYSQTTHLNGFQAITHGGFANQAFASRGYMVFFPGPRLPWTYGSLAATPAEAEQLRGAGGWDVTVDDVESGVDELIARGLVDSTRMAIIGFSNGGAVAVAVLTRTNRYRGVVAVAPANINWVQLALFRDDLSGRWIPPATFTGIDRELWEDPAPWVAGSPVFHIGEARSPTLLAVGDRDGPSFTIPTVELYLGLRRLGRDVTLLRYAAMGHGFYGPAGNDLAKRVLEFVEERLRP